VRAAAVCGLHRFDATCRTADSSESHTAGHRPSRSADTAEHPFADSYRRGLRRSSSLYDNYINYHNGSLSSRYVLYDDSTFALQFQSPRFGSFDYLGRYTRVDSQIIFSWDGWSTAGPWGATAVLRGDSLKVSYNVIMMLSGFVGGTYVRSGTP